MYRRDYVEVARCLTSTVEEVGTRSKQVLDMIIEYCDCLLEAEALLIFTTSTVSNVTLRGAHRSGDPGTEPGHGPREGRILLAFAPDPSGWALGERA